MMFWHIIIRYFYTLLLEPNAGVVVFKFLNWMLYFGYSETLKNWPVIQVKHNIIKHINLPVLLGIYFWT